MILVQCGSKFGKLQFPHDSEQCELRVISASLGSYSLRNLVYLPFLQCHRIIEGFEANFKLLVAHDSDQLACQLLDRNSTDLV